MGKVAKQIRVRDCDRCVYCGRTEKTSGAKLHLDHLTPKSVGGQDVATNLALACARCNGARKDLSLSDWAKKAAADFGLKVDPRRIRAQARRSLPEV